MKINVTTKMRQPPKIEIDGKDIVGMPFEERLTNLHKIVEKIPDLSNWFEQFLFALCLEFGEEIPDDDFGKDVFELEL